MGGTENILPPLMLLSLAVLLFSGYPVAFVLAGVGITFALVGYALDAFKLIQFSLIPLRIYGNVGENPVYPAVPMLIFLGYVLESSGIAREMLRCLQILLHRLPGSIAVSVIVIGLVLAPTAGMLGASVAMLTVLALPMMLAQHYDTALAAGTIAAAGTLGIIMPPAIMLFFLADLFSTQVAAMFLGTIVPSLMLAVLYVVYAVGRCGANRRLAPPSAADDPGRATTSSIAMLAQGFALPLLLLTAVLASIVAGWATPNESASVGAAMAVILTVLNRSFSIVLLKEIIFRTTLTTAMVFFIIMSATVFSYVFRLFGGDDLMVNSLRGLGLGDMGMFGLIMLIIFVSGFFFDWIEIVLVTLAILLPVLGKLDFSGYVGYAGLAPTWVAILIALNLQTSFLTPPFGFALFFLKGAAQDALDWSAIYRGVLPFILIQLLVIAIVALFPGIALWLPHRYLA